MITRNFKIWLHNLEETSQIYIMKFSLHAPKEINEQFRAWDIFKMYYKQALFQFVINYKYSSYKTGRLSCITTLGQIFVECAPLSMNCWSPRGTPTTLLPPTHMPQGHPTYIYDVEVLWLVDQDNTTIEVIFVKNESY